MKKSVFLSEETVAFINRYSSRGDNVEWSAGINGAVSVLNSIINDSMPVLSRYEWDTILGVFNGTFNPAFERFGISIASCMMDDRGELSFDTLKQHDPDYADVVERAHNMTATEQIIVLLVCQAFWANRNVKLNDLVGYDPE